MIEEQQKKLRKLDDILDNEQFDQFLGTDMFKQNSMFDDLMNDDEMYSPTGLAI